MTTQIKIMILFAIFVAGIGVGWTSAWKIQGARVGKMQSDKAMIEAQIGECQNANIENANTINRLKTDADKVRGLYESRLKIKHSLVERIEEIDNLKTQVTQVTQVTKDETSGAPDDADPLLDELNGMFTGKAGRKN